jgi:hypothetical protein
MTTTRVPAGELRSERLAAEKTASPSFDRQPKGGGARRAGRSPNRQTFAALAALLTVVGMTESAAAQVAARRTADFVTLYTTNGLSGPCLVQNNSPAHSLRFDYRLSPTGVLQPFVVPPRQTLVITGIEYQVVGDANREVNVGIYVDGTNHPIVALPARSDALFGNAGVALAHNSWQPGILITSGHRPCLADIGGGPISKQGFAYAMLHGYLTPR